MSKISSSQSANALRILALDSVKQANSGHSGMPMGMAEIATSLWGKHLNHNPLNPHRFDRDRFVLSNGHGSMLLYSLLYLTGYKSIIQDLKDFRKLHSKTAGHPEFGITPGVETTTGPLGQGIANAVGMAIAEKTLASKFNTQKHKIIDHTIPDWKQMILMSCCNHNIIANSTFSYWGALFNEYNYKIVCYPDKWFGNNEPIKQKSMFDMFPSKWDSITS